MYLPQKLILPPTTASLSLVLRSRYKIRSLSELLRLRCEAWGCGSGSGDTGLYTFLRPAGDLGHVRVLTWAQGSDWGFGPVTFRIIGDWVHYTT